MLGKKISGVLIALVLLIHFNSWSQLKTNSFYSRYGIGNLLQEGFIRNSGMAGTGVAMPQQGFINNLNPALLSYHDITIYEFVLMGQNRNIEDGENQDDFYSGNLDYIAIAFPIDQDFWSFSAAVQPYSNANLRTSFQTQVPASPDNDGEPVDQSQIRDYNGALTEVYFSNGFKVYKGLSLGLRTSYIFGSIERENILELDLPTQPDQSYDKNKVRYRFLNLKPGVNYRHQLKNELFANIAATYAFNTGLANSSFSRFSGYRQAGLSQRGDPGFITYYEDTLKNNVNFTPNFPETYKFGLSFDKHNHWSLGLDLAYGRWSEFNHSDGSGDLDDNFEIRMGGEYTPDADAIGNYLKKIIYRGGVFYENTPVVINNTQIKKFGVNFGFSFPMRMTEKVHPQESTTLTVNFGLGQMGSLKNDLVRERYMKLFLGININDKWFQKSKYN